MKISFIIFLLAAVVSDVAAASHNYYFRHYTNKNGLSHNTVYCSLQDRKGFMWFGSDDGLNRFDGYSFQIFRYNNQDNSGRSLINDRIISFTEDSSGKIWVCTSGGVCFYDYETGFFHPFIPDTQSAPYFAEQICEDKSGNIWLRDYFKITRYHKETNAFRTYHSDEYNFRSVTMTMTEEGIPVFADASALFVYDPESDDFDRLLSLEKFRKNEMTVIMSVKEVPQVGFFVGTDQEGLLFYHADNGVLETVIPEIHVRSIMQFNANTYWIASESGIYIYNLIDKSVVNLRKSLTNDYTIADNAVYSLTKDREGGVWVSSFFGGINYLPKNYTNFTYYIGGKTHPGMLGNTIREICPDKYGNLWLGTEDNGINRFDPETNTMVNYSLLNPERKLAATNIHGLYAQGDTLWIGSFNKGIELMHIPTGKIFGNYNSANTNGGLISNFILCFYRTRRGELLVGTSNGVVIFDEKNNTFSPWKGVGGLVRQILEDETGNIWVSTNGGLYKYTPPAIGADGIETAEKVSRYVETPSSRSQGLGSSNTTSVFEDSKGRIWITTVYGFSLYNKYTDSFNRITTSDGLPSNMIYRIAEDEEHLFWVSTANGLVRFNPETHVIHTYSYSDGLHETQFNFSSSYKSPDGVIYMGTVNGMISFDPKQFTKDTYIPQLYITRIHVHDHPGDSRFLLRNVSNELKLPYHSSTFTVSYIAPGYTSPDAIKYAYLLDGVDKEWIYMDKNKEVTFANLSPGEYTFRVRSTNSSDIWQDNVQTLHIVITPPFWATLWAYSAYLLMIVLCPIAFYRYKKRKFLRKARRNRKLFEVEKEKELYNAKIRFFTFITHEIRTPLTLIKAPLEKIMRSEDGNAATRQNLEIIEKNTQRLLDLSNQLLDFRKTESRGFRLNFVKTDVILMMENILTPFIPVFHNENKKFSADLPEKHFFAYIDRDAFTKIVTNMLTNALKYSSGSITCMSAEDESGGTFRVVVTNDGVVVPEKEREKIFTPFYRPKETENVQGSGIGLSLSRTLAEFHHGSIDYQETPEGLNRFILTLPVRQDEYNFDLSESRPPDSHTAAAEELVVTDGTDRPVLLIVEDQQDMRRFLVEELSCRYEIADAENGKQALALLEKNRVDLIISDIMMPLMDGYELCDEVKSNIQYSHIPFILLTARHNLQSRLTGLSQGADAYMEKPFSLEHLSLQIENLLKNRERIRRVYLEKPQTPVSSLAVSRIDNQFLEKLNLYIEENLTNEQLSVEMIAGEMGMSNSSLYRKVKAISDLSPVDFIRMARLKKAVRLMQSGEKRVGEIAYLVGFSSPAYFSTTFQKQYGKSPSEFLKEQGAGL
ncbi:MAG: response regulator [Tannerella sp.]|jgi:signal transduction histidine kinase/ligand-binding sensor domain-containing protein/DNA-binding response OmpR family regulator|nr:response regulator [Tannerella sp.]